MKCKECNKDVDLEMGDEIFPGSGKIGYEPVELCRECFSKGWTDNPIEVVAAIAADPILKNIIGIVSPIQRKDLPNDI